MLPPRRRATRGVLIEYTACGSQPALGVRLRPGQVLRYFPFSLPATFLPKDAFHVASLIQASPEAGQSGGVGLRRPDAGVMPHSPYFGPGLIATLHVIAACLPD